MDQVKHSAARISDAAPAQTPVAQPATAADAVAVAVASEHALLSALAHALRKRAWRMASAESCTGGLIAAACTAQAGASDWFERGWVTYSNAAKIELLGVEPALLATQGAVSEAVACAMAAGAMDRAPVQCSVAVTGIAGPGGAVAGKPVGTVWLALASAQGVAAQRLQLAGDRSAVRQATVQAALEALLRLAQR